MSVTMALGQCWLCGQAFEYDTGSVDVIVIDSATGWPPDYDPATGMFDRIITAEMLDRCFRLPLCCACAESVSS